MCQICAGLRPVDPGCIYSEAAAAALPAFDWQESRDAAADLSTSYAIAVGDTFLGTIQAIGDRDWVAVELVAGEVYSITLDSAGDTPLRDPFLQLYDSSGTLVASDDDGGPGSNAALTFQADSTGTHYIEAGGFRGLGRGDYVISIEMAEPLRVFTDTEMAEYLISGFWEEWGGLPYPHAFDIGTDGSLNVDITELTAAGQQFATWAFEIWTYSTGIEFVFVDESLGDTAEIFVDDAERGAFGGATLFDGSTITRSEINISAGWIRDDLDADGNAVLNTYSTQTFVHEIGHALGLGHAGNYNGTGGYSAIVGQGDNDYLNDSWQATVMSYFSQTDNTYIDADYAFVMTPMIVDLLAIEMLYGPNPTLNDGDTVYGRGSSFGGVVDQFALIDSGTPIAFTIVDAGGVDTLDIGHLALGSDINLHDGSHSGLNGVAGNMSIAHGTILENVILGSGSDRLIGNEADNHITSSGGDDIINGGMGWDTVLLDGAQASYTVRNVNGTTVLRGNGDTVRLLNVEEVVFADGTLSTAGTSLGLFEGWHLRPAGMVQETGWAYGWHYDWTMGWNYSTEWTWLYGWHLDWRVDWAFGWYQDWSLGWHTDWAWGPTLVWDLGWFTANGWGWSWTGTGWTYAWGWTHQWGWHQQDGMGWMLVEWFGWDAQWAFGWNAVWSQTWDLGWYGSDGAWVWSWQYSWDHGWDYGGWFWYAGDTWGWGRYYGWDYGTFGHAWNYVA